MTNRLPPDDRVVSRTATRDLSEEKFLAITDEELVASFRASLAGARADGAGVLSFVVQLTAAVAEHHRGRFVGCPAAVFVAIAQQFIMATRQLGTIGDPATAAQFDRAASQLAEIAEAMIAEDRRRRGGA